MGWLNLLVFTVLTLVSVCVLRMTFSDGICEKENVLQDTIPFGGFDQMILKLNID